MEKQASVITVAKIPNGYYSVDARGAFGGGWTRPAKEDELANTITRAWQMYGSNPLGCQIIGQLPPEVQELANKLMSSGATRDAVITLRLPQIEAEAIREAAAFEGRSVNQWCRIALGKMAADVNRPPKEAE